MCPLSAVSDVPRPVTDTAGFARIDPHCFRGRIVAIPRKFSTTAHVKRHNDKLCRLTRRFPGQEELYGFRVGGMEAGGAEGKRQGVERAGNKYRRMVRDDRRGGAAQVRSRQHPTRDLFRRWTWSISTSRAACNVATVPIIELGIGARVRTGERLPPIWSSMASPSRRPAQHSPTPWAASCRIRGIHPTSRVLSCSAARKVGG